MDRFIDNIQCWKTGWYWHLKSNMDRFIGGCAVIADEVVYDLKSNMDRFIEKADTFI